jgi:CHAD domain-containing protein
MAAKTFKIPPSKADIPLSECLHQIITPLFKNAFSSEKGARKGDTDSIHEMRVATIKLLSVLNAFFPCFKKRSYKKNFLEAEKLLKRLGNVRKIDVFKEILEKYYQNPKDIKPLISKYSHKRLVFQKRLKVTLVRLKKTDFKKKYFRFANKSLVSNTKFKIEMPLRESLENILPHTAQEMINNLKNATKSPTLLKELHKTRIKAKPLKAISEISVSLFDKEFENCYNEIKEILSVMGEIHDLDETITIIEKSRKKRWYKRILPNLERIKNHRSALFEKLREITEHLENSMFAKRISLAMQYKSEIKRGET